MNDYWNHKYLFYDELMVSPEFNDTVRNLDRKCLFMDLEGTKINLRGDIVEIQQRGFMDGIKLLVMFSNKPDMLFKTHQVWAHITDMDILKAQSENIKSEMYIEAECVFEPNLMGDVYPSVRIDKITELNERLKFPPLMCCRCGKNYENDYQMINDPYKRKYCQICGEQDSIIFVTNREEFMHIPKPNFE